MLQDDITINIALPKGRFEYKEITKLTLMSSISPSDPLWVEDDGSGSIFRVLAIDSYVAQYNETEGFSVECPIIIAKYIDDYGKISELIVTANGEIESNLLPFGNLMTEQQLLSQYLKLKQASIE